MNLALNESVANERAAQYFPPPATRCQCSSVFPSCCVGVKQRVNKGPLIEPNRTGPNIPPAEIKIPSQGVVTAEITGGLPSDYPVRRFYCNIWLAKTLPSFFVWAGERYHPSSVRIVGVWVRGHLQHRHPFDCPRMSPKACIPLQI